MATDWSSISAQRKRQIRAEMLRRWKQKLRKKGAAKAAGGNVKAAGGTGSMKGAGLTKLERDYAKTVRRTQNKKADADATYVIPGTKKTRKAVAKTARTTGAGNVKLVKKAKQRVMKSKSKGGTVSHGSHAGDDKKLQAAAWRRKHLKAAGDDVNKQKKIQKRYFHMRGKKLPKKYQ